jgi:hypothetical protein
MLSVQRDQELTAPGQSWLLTMANIAQQTIALFADYRVALAHAGLQACPAEHRDVATAVANVPRLLQMPGSLGNAFAPYAEHAGNQFLRHGQFV